MTMIRSLQMGQSLEAFLQWKALVSLLFSCIEAPLKTRSRLFIKVIRVVYSQLKYGFHKENTHKENMDKGFSLLLDDEWITKDVFLFHLCKVYHTQFLWRWQTPTLGQMCSNLRKRRIGVLSVVDKTRKKEIGNISLRDVQHLLTSPEIFKDYRSITTKDFISTVRNHIKEEEKDSSGSLEVVSCKRDDTIKDVIIKLDAAKIQRVYVVYKDGNLEGVITLRDIISRLVHEPNGYFGDFFDGVVPLPENSTSKKHLLEMTNPFLELRSATIHHAQIHICSVDCVKYLTGNGVENLFTLHVQWAAQILRVIDPQKRGDIQS